MKIKIVLAVLLGLSVLAFVYRSSEKGNYITSPSVQQAGGFNDSFFIGALTCGSQTLYSQYDSLRFNLWSCYRQPGGILGWTHFKNIYPSLEHDSLFADYNNYGAGLSGLYNDNLNQHGMRTLMDRTKITYLGYGARSDYQCEDESYLAPDLQNYWFYTYYEHPVGVNYTDYTQYGYGVKGKYCTPNNTTDGGVTYLQMSPGYVVKRLKCNREQVSMNQGSGSDWIDDYLHKWYVKPRIRIDSNFAHNNPNTSVCRIDIVKWNGDTLKTITLTGLNFLDNYLHYDGKYIENYFHLDSNSLTFGPGDEMNPYPYHRADDWADSCYVDFRVWWYGNCDMWIDRIRVEDETAMELFRGDYDNTWLQWEAEIATASNGPLQFYMEEWEFNNLPCMKYVSNKLSTLTDGKYNLMANLNYGRMFYHINPHYNKYIDADTTEDIEYVKRMFIDSLSQRQIYTGAYPFEGYQYQEPPNSGNWKPSSPIPNTLKNVPSYDPANGLLTMSVSPSAYETWLQAHINSPWYLSYLKTMRIADKISKDKTIPFVNLVQTHLHYSSSETRREPSNEELNLMVNLGLTYGAKSNLYFWYWSYNTYNDSEYSRGLTGSGSNDDKQPRYLNVYGQLKWQEIKNINNHLYALAPYIMRFDNTNRHSYYYLDLDEKNLLLQNSYFLEAVTAKPTTGEYPCNLDDPQPYATGLLYDCPEERYLQIATFQSGETYPNYFMVVNRRCSPENSDPFKTGKRFVRVRLKANFLPSNSPYTWCVQNVITGETFTFDRRYIANVNLCNPNNYYNWFQPGEGRLFHILPTTETGGVINTDEYIPGGTYTLQDTLFTNGHNLTIGFGTTINFTDSACIVVNGGSFTCGDVSLPTHERNIIFKGVTNNKWGGLLLDGCGVVNINSARFQDVKNSNEGTNYAIKMLNCYTFNINNCTFTNADPQKTGAIEAYYSGANPNEATPNLYIAGNTFNMNSSDKTIISIIANTNCNVPVIIDNNIFTSTSNSATAMYLSFVNGIKIGGNAIVGFNKGIEMHYSNIDIIGNTITSTTGNNGANRQSYVQ